jgi:hypothetical protein
MRGPAATRGFTRCVSYASCGLSAVRPDLAASAGLPQPPGCAKTAALHASGIARSTATVRRRTTTATVSWLLAAAAPPLADAPLTFIKFSLTEQGRQSIVLSTPSTRLGSYLLRRFAKHSRFTSVVLLL